MPVARAYRARVCRALLAITSPDNMASIRLLEKLGFGFVRFTSLAEGQPEVKLFSRALA